MVQVRFRKKRRHNVQLDIVFLRQGMANPRKDTSRIDVLDAALSPRIQKWPGFEDFQKVTWWDVDELIVYFFSRRQPCRIQDSLDDT
jgi:hypothetical protein